MSEEFDDNLVFKALANETRRRILDSLKPGPQTTGSLAKAFPELDRTTVMQHLGVLTESGLVVPERRGKERWNHLNVVPIQQIHQRWIGAYAGYVADKLSGLEVALAAPDDAPADSDTSL